MCKLMRQNRLQLRLVDLLQKSRRYQQHLPQDSNGHRSRNHYRLAP